MRRTLICLLCVVWVLVFPDVGQTADWPQWRGPNRDGVSAEVLNVTKWPPTVVWSNTLTIGESSVAVSEGRLYTTGREGPTNLVYCLDAATGTNIWTQTYLTNGSLARYGDYGPQATPTVSGSEVYTFDDGGKLCCFNRTSGAVLWNTALNLKRPQYAFASSPLVEGDLIFLNGSGVGAAVSKTTYNLVWPTGTLPVGTAYASAQGMTVNGVRLILVQTANALKAMSTNGVQLWSYPYDSASVSGYAAADPVVWGDKILLYENGLVLLQVGTNSVTEVWPLNTDTFGASFCTPVIVGSYAYTINNAGELVRISLSNGSVDWNMTVSSYVQGALTAVDGKLIVLADGQLRVVTIGTTGFDEGGRVPVTVVDSGFTSYGWTPPVVANGTIYCRVGRTLVCYSVAALLPGPHITMDTNDVVVSVVRGTVATQSVTIANAGDATLTWTLTDVFEGTIVRQFPVAWSTPYSMKYDATRDCLWAHYYANTNVAQLSVADGSLLGIKSTGANLNFSYSIEVEGGNLWGQHNANKQLVKINLSDMSVLQRISFPSGWLYVQTMAKGDGKLFGQDYGTSLRRLDPDTGAVLQTFTIPDTLGSTRHLGYSGGYLWWGTRTSPYNRLVKWDPSTGKVRSKISVGGWASGCTVYDVSVAATNTQLWTLTYQHQTGVNERWAHLLDITGSRRIDETPLSGSIAPGGSTTVALTCDGTGISGVFPVRIVVESNGGGPKEKLVTFVVHASGDNHAPTANAGPDQETATTGTTARVTLNGSASSDPDGDSLTYTWREGGTIIATVANPTLNIGLGVHNIVLTVDDSRGCTASDTVRIVVGAPDIAFAGDNPSIRMCPQGTVVTQTVTVLNAGSLSLIWTMTNVVDGSVASRVTSSPWSGTIAAGGSADVRMTFDGRGAAIGVYPVQLVFTSNDPDRNSATDTVNVVVHAAGPNHPPVANAGPDRTERIAGVTAPFILNLSGAGSTDPDNDPLLRKRWTWTATGQPLVASANGLIELGAGIYGFTLTVDDYRGGVSADQMTVTVLANQPSKDWPQWYGPDGSGWAPETNANWLANWPPIVAWRRSDITGGGYRNNGCPVVSEGRVYYSSSWGLSCVDAVTGNTIWSTGFNGGNPTPAVDEDRIYVGTSVDQLCCIDKRTGAWLWSIRDPDFIQDTDGSGTCFSPLVYGDLVIYNKFAMNKYTGTVMWKFDSAYVKLLSKRHTWNGRTYFTQEVSPGDCLVDMITGVNVASCGYASYSSANGAIFYGNDKTWAVTRITQINGGVVTVSGATPGEAYHQPVVVGDYGYFIKGGHGAGGQVCGVDLKAAKQVWQGGWWGTFIAVNDRLIAHASGYVGIIKCGVPTYVEEFPSYRYDQSGANNFALPAYANQRIYIVASGGLTCLYTGLSAPAIENGSGLWHGDTGTAELLGRLVNTGGMGSPAQVWMYWGNTDGGTNAGLWEHCETFGTRFVGELAKDVGGLTRNAVYYYRYFSSNAIGGTWASETKRLETYDKAWDEGGLVLHWPLDEGVGLDAGDVSGSGNHGYFAQSSSGTPVTWNVWTSGAVNKGVSLGGQTRAWCKDLTATVVGDYTFSGWVNYTTVADGNGSTYEIMRLVGPNGNGSEGLTVLDNSRTGWGYKIDSPAGRSLGALHDGLWHNLALVREGLTYRLYVDGSLNASASVGSVNDLISLDSLYVSGMSGLYPQTVNWDDVRLYKRALSSQEVTVLSQMTGTNQPAVCATGIGSDDAEERWDGTVVLTNTTLRMVRDATSGSNQVVGLRFPNVNIPRGATILGATLQFRSAVAGSETTWLSICGQAADNAATFAATARNLTGRPKTSAALFWEVPVWTTVTNAVPSQATPDVKAVVQEIVDRDGWTNGNALAFLIDGSGLRVVQAIEKAGGVPPALRIIWTDKADADGNGIPDVWERKAGTGHVFEPLADDDGDGMSNLSEYIAGTDPGSSNSLLGMWIRMLSGGRLVTGFDGRCAQGMGYTTGQKRYYSLESRTSLPIGTGVTANVWSTVPGMSNVLIQTDRAVEYTNAAPGSAGFYRVRVKLE